LNEAPPSAYKLEAETTPHVYVPPFESARDLHEFTQSAEVTFPVPTVYKGSPVGRDAVPPTKPEVAGVAVASHAVQLAGVLGFETVTVAESEAVVPAELVHVIS
jgi:hypothetical protein